MQPQPFGADLPAWPNVDFGLFGPVEVRPRSRIQTLVAAAMRRNWLHIPHVTHHDEADITQLEAERVAHNERDSENKLTLLPYLIKAVVAALKANPLLNTSLDASGNLVYKQYFHIGVAVETPNGLLVPVIRDCDRRSLAQIRSELRRLASLARGRGLPMSEMQGGCFTITSLGGIGGTAFTPIINAPEVGILGVSKAAWQARRAPHNGVIWRLMIPLDLSYDHRVVNGADAARFAAAVATALANPSALTANT